MIAALAGALGSELRDWDHGLGNQADFLEVCLICLG